MEYKPQEIPDEMNVNVTPIHPLVNFANLLITVVVVSTLVYLGLGVVATQLVTRISPEMEMKIGQRFVPKVSTTSTKSYPQELAYLNQILLSLPTPDGASSIPLTIHIQKSEELNAGILPGGHIINRLIKSSRIRE